MCNTNLKFKLNEKTHTNFNRKIWKYEKYQQSKLLGRVKIKTPKRSFPTLVLFFVVHCVVLWCIVHFFVHFSNSDAAFCCAFQFSNSGAVFCCAFQSQLFIARPSSHSLPGSLYLCVAQNLLDPTFLLPRRHHPLHLSCSWYLAFVINKWKRRRIL